MNTLDPINEVQVALAELLDDPTVAGAGVPADQIHYPYAGEGRTLPYILLDCIDAPEKDRTFAGATWTDQIWAIRVVTQDDVLQASAIATAVHALVENSEFAIAGYRNLCCLRRRPIPPRPVQGDDSIVRIHAGGEYNIGVGEPS